MSFLQPLLLAALPIASLPIIIHLINQRRYQTIDWGAMRFLLEANRMSRGYARIRQWLILLFRTLVIAALIIAIARPLASGWLGLAGGGTADTTLILVDRSPSMTQRGAGAAESKLETGVRQLSQALRALGSSRWVLIDSVTQAPRELESPAALLNTGADVNTSAASDMPALLQAAHDYIQQNQSGETEIWICSDLRSNDWNAASGRWRTLRDSFLEFKQGVRFHLLAYPDAADANVAVRVTDVRRAENADGAALLVSLRIACPGNEGKRNVPVQFEIEGARSELAVECEGPEYQVRDHVIPVDRDKKRGWGRVSIPADENAADNEFYFVFDEAPVRRTILVTEDPTGSRPLELAAAISPDPSIKNNVEAVELEQLPAVAWEEIGLLLWQAPLPTDKQAELVKAYVERGGQVVFFPPGNSTQTEFFGGRWGTWTQPPQPIAVDTWRSDQDLLARTQSGTALPVGEIAIRRYCELQGDLIPLAKLPGGAALLARAATPQGGVYFCSTTASMNDSTMATNGIALYVAIQRALSAGAKELGATRQVVAGESKQRSGAPWTRMAGAEGVLSTEYAAQGGVYSVNDRILAVNRSLAEEQAEVLDSAKVDELFRGLEYSRADDQAGNFASLMRETWRLFLGIMIFAMVAEAALCLPRVRPAAGGLP